jgi:hypothetical protein
MAKQVGQNLLIALKSSILDFIRVNPYIRPLPIPKGLTMSKIVKLIKALIPSVRSNHELDDRYLSKASDACDLERSMYELDIRAREASRGLIWGFKAW